MKRIHAWLLAGATVLTLASCGKQPESPQAMSPAADSTATQPIASSSQGFTALQGVVTKTTAAVEGGNFEQAEMEFGKFEDSWKTVEDGIKAKSSQTYDAIEESMDGVNGGIKSKNKEQVMKALQSLAKSIATAAQS
jgi:predicted small lipoprotein YifL